MKKYKIFTVISLIIAVSICLINCSSEQINSMDELDNSENTSNTKLENPYNYIGELHNKGLTYIYNGLKVMNFKKDGILDSVYLLYTQFIYDEGISITPEEALYLFNMGIQMAEYNQNSEISLLDSVITNSELSSEQREFLYRISNLEKAVLSLNTLKDSVAVLNSEVIEKLPDDDQMIILAASSILIYSTEYWNEHIDEWEILLNEITGGKSKEGCIVGEDIIGAIAGAVIHSAIEAIF